MSLPGNRSLSLSCHPHSWKHKTLCRRNPLDFTSCIFPHNPPPLLSTLCSSQTCLPSFPQQAASFIPLCLCKYSFSYPEGLL